MPKKIISYGETLWDLFNNGPRLGGAPCNLAMRIHMLGERGWLVTRLGADELGEQALASLRKAGLQSSFIQIDPFYATGTVDVKLNLNGVPDFTINPNAAYDHITAREDVKVAASTADCICFGTLAQRSDVSKESLYALLNSVSKTLKFLDLNLREGCYTHSTVKRSLEYADILKLNEDEARYLLEEFEIEANDMTDAVSSIAEIYDLTVVIITLGGSGVLVGNDKGEHVYEPGFIVEVVDTTGSGDAFSAGFITRYLNGATFAEAAHYGNALGALVATTLGGTEPVSPEDIEAFIASYPERSIDPTYAH